MSPLEFRVLISVSCRSNTYISIFLRKPCCLKIRKGTPFLRQLIGNTWTKWDRSCFENRRKCISILVCVGNDMDNAVIYVFAKKLPIKNRKFNNSVTNIFLILFHDTCNRRRNTWAYKYILLRF